MARQLAEPPPSRRLPTNGQATAGLWVGIISILFNTFLIVSVLGLVLSFTGLGKASGYEATTGYPVGRTKARWGVFLGILGLVNSLAWKWLVGFTF